MNDASAILSERGGNGEVSRRGFLRGGGAALCAAGTPVAVATTALPPLTPEVIEAARVSVHSVWISDVLPMVRAMAMLAADDPSGRSAPDCYAADMEQTDNTERFLADLAFARTYLRQRLAVLDAGETRLRAALARRRGGGGLTLTGLPMIHLEGAVA